MKRILFAMFTLALIYGCEGVTANDVANAAFPGKEFNDNINSGKIKVIKVSRSNGSGVNIIYANDGTYPELASFQSGDDLHIIIKSGHGTVILRTN